MKAINFTTMTIVAICALPMAALAGNPPIPEPSTIFAGALCLVPVAIGVVRLLRKPRR